MRYVVILFLVVGLLGVGAFLLYSLQSGSQKSNLPKIASEIQQTSIEYFDTVKGEKVKPLKKIALLRANTGQEIDFDDTGAINIQDLIPGENNFLLVNYYLDGTSETSEGIRVFYDSPPAECQRISRHIGSGLAQNFEVCQDGIENPKDKYCINGNPDIDNCNQQPSRKDNPVIEYPDSVETSIDNGDGTYNILVNGVSVSQKRFYDHRQVVAKCRDTSTELNTLVFVNEGKERIDVDCRDLNQSCVEFVNPEGQADATCQ